MFIAILLAFAANAHAQGLIWVKGQATDALFGDITAAYNAAQPGDKIYLPGGAFALPEISKQVHIVGVGWDRRMTAATGPTFITNPVVTLANNNADHSSFEGLRFADQIYLYASYVTFKRCFFKHIEIFENLAGNVFIQNVIYSLGCRPTNGTETVATFHNNVMRTIQVWTSSRASFYNNVFLIPAHGHYIKNGVFRKNIVMNQPLGPGTYSIYECINVAVEDNVFEETNVIGVTNCSLVGNLTGVPASEIFENVPAGASTFSETYDFRLKPGSPARFGTPETTDDAGIYGGDYPWKDGLLPANPHIDFKYAPPSAAGNNLNVRLRVSAQSE